MDGILESAVNAEPVVNVEPQTEANETNLENVQGSEGVNTEVATVENKHVQSQEDNARFAEVRRKAEAEAETRTRDKMISEMYGSTHGIHTYAEYQEAIAKQEQEEHDQNIREEYEAKGLPEDVINELVEWKNSREQAKAEEEAKQQQEQKQADMKDFINAFPDVKADEIPTEVWQANANGIPLRYAYAEHALKLARAAETKAKANAENAKGSMGSIGSNGTANDGYYTKEQVNKMTSAEVARNYEKICESTRKW